LLPAGILAFTVHPNVDRKLWAAEGAIASDAKQSRATARQMDCFVALLLAMTTR
jgi:hypothetical protein